MANCHKLFIEFNNLIALSPKRKKTLRTSRNAVRERIRKYFHDKQNGFVPKFHGQGSFMMNTIIEPIDGEFDIDDGIYFKVDADPSQSIDTFHRWISEALDGHTKEKSVDKHTCVRLIYARQYHLDLPIYCIIEGQNPRLAHKGKGWIESDPREFIKWFNKKADSNGQLKRVVRYLKAWSNYRKGTLPSGLVFSILAVNNISFDERDDIALYQTLLNIKNSLESSFTCYRPTIPFNENLLEKYSQTNKKYFLGQLDSFIRSSQKALDEKTNLKDACKAWQLQFSEERFPFESEEFIEDSFQVNIKYDLAIDCLVSQKGWRNHPLSKMLLDKTPLFSGGKLTFHIVSHNVPAPFKVKWKVRNCGKEAIIRNQIRGQILDDGGNHQRIETSDFFGEHFVECYIIKDNICVARHRIDVPIKGVA